MSSMTFVDHQTVVPAAWLNDVNESVYNPVYKSVKLFGAKGDGITDDTAAFIAAAAANKYIVVANGTFLVNTCDLGETNIKVLPTARIRVPDGQVMLTRRAIEAGNYQIFDQTGVVVSGGKRNIMWWGAVPSRTNPGPVVARSNTVSCRKAAMSFNAEYELNAGKITAPGPSIPFSVWVPEGLFYLSNGFAAAVRSITA